MSLPLLFYYPIGSERQIFAGTARSGRKIFQRREILKGVCLADPRSSFGLRRAGIAKVDIIGVDLRAAALVALLVLPLADLEPPLYHGHAAFGKILAAKFSGGAPCHHIKEVGLLFSGLRFEIAVTGNTIHAQVSDEEFARRRAEQLLPEPRVKNGWLARYQRLVTSADEGAVLK